MTEPTDHLDDEVLSALVDDELSRDEMAFAQSHLAACAACRERLDDFRSVAVLVRRLPEIDPRQNFALGPRLVVDPPNVIRLRRWYTATRAAAASLAAVFVLLSAGALYLDSRPGAAPAAEVAKPQVLSAPAPAQPPAAAQRAAAPQSSPAAPALGPASGAAAARPVATERPDDQVAATTSVSALPTLPPTPTLAPVVAPPVQAPATADPAAPLRMGAFVFGILAALSLLVTLVVRHRLLNQPL